MKCNFWEKAVYYKLDKELHPERLEEVDAYRVFGPNSRPNSHRQGRRLDVLGRNSKGRLYHIIHDADTGKVWEENPIKGKTNNGLYRSIICSAVGVGLPWLVYELMPGQRKRRSITGDYNQLVEIIRGENMKDLTKAVKDIKVYQLPMDDVSKLLNKELELVDTKNPETFIKAEDTFWLRVRAHELDADAVVTYNPGSSIGTPVRFKK